jgi:hypothetical protein
MASCILSPGAGILAPVYSATQPFGGSRRCRRAEKAADIVLASFERRAQIPSALFDR